MAALIDRHESALAASIESCVAAHRDRSLREALLERVDIGIAQQYARPLLAAALDHEEARLPLGPRLRGDEKRIGIAVTTLLQRHASELAAPLQPSDVQDIFVIAKAMIEADASAGRTPPADLRDRVARALSGYLKTPPAAGGTPAEGGWNASVGTTPGAGRHRRSAGSPARAIDAGDSASIAAVVSRGRIVALVTARPRRGP
ncbi:MAG: hypothetical protein RJA99_1384 [Pseudomonadota bacterium]